MKALFVTPLLLLAMCTQGQLWCPDGAVWKCNFISGGPYEGCETRMYVGDTLIEGFVSQHIIAERISNNFTPNGIDTVYHHTYTRIQDSIVYELFDAFMPSQYWDTLYWFGAQEGDHWRRPGPTNGCFVGKMEMLGSYDQLFGSASLRVYVIIQWNNDDATEYFQFQMIERLGTPFALHPDCAFTEVGGPFTRYTDNAGVDYQTGIASFCDSYTAIPEPGPALKASVFPNPGDDHLQISFTHSASDETLRVHDVHGRLVAQQAVQRSSFTLDTSLWNSGQYILSVVGGAGQYFSTRWSKQ